MGNVNWLLKMEINRDYFVERLVGGNLKSLPSLDSHDMISLNRKLYVFGGFRTDSMQRCVNDILRIDPDSQTFSSVSFKGDIPHPRQGMSLCLCKDNSFVVFGGSDEHKKFRDAFLFNLNTCSWSVINGHFRMKEGIEGHAMVFHQASERFIVFGGIHGDAEENRLMFSFDMDGRLEIIQEKDVAGKTKQRTTTNRQRDGISTSKTADSKNRSKEVKSRGKRFFLHTKYELKYYESEFIVKDEREKCTYRREDQASLQMKETLFSLGLFSSNQGFYNMLRDEKTKQLLEKNSVDEDRDPLSSPSDFVRGSNRPLPREGFAMILQRDRLLIVGGMRHTLAFNDVSFILVENLGLPAVEIPVHVPVVSIDPKKQILFALD